jgi:hypothetical protein
MTADAPTSPYPIHHPGMLTADVVADLQGRAIEAVALPPYDGRGASSKSFRAFSDHSGSYPVAVK